MTNPSVNQGRWMQLRGRLKAAWGRLTHDEGLRLEGNAEVVLGALEQRLGTERKRVLSALDAERKRALSALDAGVNAISKRLKRT